MKKTVETIRKKYNAAEEREQNVIGKRLAALRNRKNLSLKEAADGLSAYGMPMSAPSLFKWEKGINTPSSYYLLALCDFYGVKNAEDFFNASYVPELNDEGELKVEQYRADLIASGNYKPFRPVEIAYVTMRVGMLSVSAGTGAFLDDDSFEEMQFPADSVPARADFALRVSGDSMEPVFNDGQYIWVQRCSELYPGEVGIFALDGQGYVKVYSEQTPEDCGDYTDSNCVVHAQPVLVSYNKKYAPIVVSQEQTFQICGRVIK